MDGPYPRDGALPDDVRSSGAPLHAEVLATELATLPVLDAAVRMEAAAKGCGVRIADLRQRVARLRREAMRDNCEAQRAAASGDTTRGMPMTAAEVEAELERLSGLSRAERDAGLRALRARAGRNGCEPG